MKLRNIFMLALGLVGVLPGAGLAWQLVGPGGGGWFESLAIDPRDSQRLYAGSDVGGLFVSEDGGQNWQCRNQGLSDYFIESIAVDPFKPSRLIVGTQSGVFVSEDRGQTWQLRRQGFPPLSDVFFSAPVSVVAFDEHESGLVYAGIGQPRWQSGGCGQIYRSLDGGETWEPLIEDGAIPRGAIITDIAVSSRYVLAATDQGLYRSVDQGESWARITRGLPHAQCNELALAPSNSLVCYLTLATRAAAGKAEGGVFKSIDGGLSWRACSGGLPFRVGGAGESPYATTNYRELVVDSGDSQTVYVGADSWWHAGVYKTTDGGRNWKKVMRRAGADANVSYGWLNEWDPAITALAMAADGLILAGTPGHLLLSRDGAASWQQCYCRMWSDGASSSIGLENSVATAVASNPQTAGVLYLGFRDIGLFGCEVSSGRCARLGGLRTSIRHLSPVPGSNRLACVAEQSDGDAFYLLAADGSLIAQPKGLPAGRIDAILLPEALAGLTLAAVAGQGLYVIENGQWQAFDSELNHQIKNSSFRLCAAGEQFVLVAMDQARISRLYWCEPRSRTWREYRLGRVLGEIQAVIAGESGLLLASRRHYDQDSGRFWGGGLYLSEDEGQSWTLVFENRFVSSVAASPFERQTVYLGTTDHPYHDCNVASGLYVSRDGGYTWHNANAGLGNLNIALVSVDSIGRLIVGADGGGFRLNGAEVAR